MLVVLRSIFWYEYPLPLEVIEEFESTERKTIITNRNDDYENCENTSMIILKPSYLSNFSSCYDLMINSTNITVSTGGTIYGSFSYVQTVFLSVDSNSSITSKGRGYSYQNIDLNTTSKYQFYGKIIFSSNFI